MDKSFKVQASVNEVSNRRIYQSYLPILIWALIVFVCLFGLSDIFPTIVNYISTVVLILDFLMLVPVAVIMKRMSVRLTKLNSEYVTSMIDIIISGSDAYLGSVSNENKITAITWEESTSKLYFVRQNRKSLSRVRILPPDSYMIMGELNMSGIKTPTIAELVDNDMNRH